MEQNNIYIIGAGAIGKALAVFLKKADRNVFLIRGSVDNIPEEKSLIKVVNQPGEKFEQVITTTSFSNLNEINGTVVVTAKTFANSAIAKKLKSFSGDFSIVLLQNGLNIEKAFDEFTNVFRCVLLSTSQVMDSGVVSFKTVTASPVGGVTRGDNPDKIVEQINTEEFGFRSETNIQKFVWEKVIINCAFNSVCPLLEADNGIFHRNENALSLARKVISECLFVAEKYDLKLDRTEVEEKLLMISKRADGQLISTYEDIRKGRQTEIDSLNLEISRLADQAGIPEKVQNTRLLGEMISVKSGIFEGNTC